MTFSDMSLQLPAADHQSMFQHEPFHHQHDQPNSISLHSLSSCPLPQNLQGNVSAAMLMGRSMLFSGMEQRCDEEIVRGEDDEMSDDGSQLLREKKRRLNMEQVKALEKSFEQGNKVEPDRKLQLSRALGLQPRQIAIWFQNRRARWKTKQLERDYDLLKTQFDALKADNHSLKSLNNKLHAQLWALKGRESGSGNRPINLNKETHEGSWSNGSDENSCDHVNNTSANIDMAGLTQVFLQSSSSTPDLLHSHEQKLNHQPAAPDEAFCTVFSGIDDHPGFWPWPDQHQNFH